MNNSVKIVIPVYKKQPNATELISFKRCLEVLGNYPIVIVAPTSLDLSFYTNFSDSIEVIRFDEAYFKDISGYNRLMLSKTFYARFIDTEYILIYQLDAYVFKDELNEWCRKGYDYIGAPVYEVRLNSFEPTLKNVTLNGGLSLRKVKSHLKVLNSFKMIYPLPFVLKNNRMTNGKFKGTILGIYNYLFCNNTYYRLNKFDRNEDFFWAIIAKRLFSDFKIPNIEETCFFSFDQSPEITFALTNHQLPFGCHAFDKNNNFWKSFITGL